MERTCHNCEHYIDELDGGHVVCERVEVVMPKRLADTSGQCSHWFAERPSTAEVIAEQEQHTRGVVNLAVCSAAILGLVWESVKESCECDYPNEDRDGAPGCPACAVMMRLKMKLAERGVKIGGEP